MTSCRGSSGPKSAAGDDLVPAIRTLCPADQTRLAGFFEKTDSGGGGGRGDACTSTTGGLRRRRIWWNNGWDSLSHPPAVD